MFGKKKEIKYPKMDWNLSTPYFNLYGNNYIEAEFKTKLKTPMTHDVICMLNELKAVVEKHKDLLHMEK